MDHDEVENICGALAECLWTGGGDSPPRRGDPVFAEATARHDARVTKTRGLLVGLANAIAAAKHVSPAGHAFVRGGRVGDECQDWEELLCKTCDLPRSAHEVADAAVQPETRREGSAPPPCADAAPAVRLEDVRAEAGAEGIVIGLFGVPQDTADDEIQAMRQHLGREPNCWELRALAAHQRARASEVTRAAGESALGGG